MMKKIFMILNVCVLAACSSYDAPQTATQNHHHAHHAKVMHQKAETDCRRAYAHMNTGFERDSKVAACVRQRSHMR